MITARCILKAATQTIDVSPEMSTKTIHIFRHSKPSFDFSMRVTGDNLNKAISEYDKSDIQNSPTPSLLNNVGMVFSSTLIRSISTAESLFPDHRINSDLIFNEAMLDSNIPSRLRMRFTSAVTISRVLWMLGFKKEVESFKQLKQRSKQGASKLVSATNMHNDVALIGHGFINRAIGQCLISKNWKLVATSGNGFESCKSYRLST